MKIDWRIVVLIAAIAFILGRFSKKVETKTEYIKGKTTTGSIAITKPTEFVPEKTILPFKYVFLSDTVRVLDTVAIIRDYSMIRDYDLNLFDNKHGKLDLKPSLQYNKIQGLEYTFTPITERETVKEVFALFAATSYNTFNIAGAGGGFFYHNIGLEYKYLWNTNTSKTGHELGVKIKF